MTKNGNVSLALEHLRLSSRLNRFSRTGLSLAPTEKIQPNGKGKVTLLFSLLLIFLMCSSADSQISRSPRVSIHEDTNFGGRSKTLPPGDFKLSDFNEIVSSIKVPDGFVAIIYEHADGGGGFGRSVDLLEDCLDLSKFNLNDKASYISVFRSTRQGFLWVRNSIVNGQFVSGHWERPRAGGNPVNTVALVSPPLPPRIPSGPKGATIEVSGAQSTITRLGFQSSAEAQFWETTKTDGIGVIGSDYRGIEIIGSAAFERDSNNVAIPDRLNFWYPQIPPKGPRDHRPILFKRTLSGTIDAEDKPRIVNIEGTFEDFDFVVHVKPLPKYRYLITQAHRPKFGVLQGLKELKEEHDLDNPCTEPFKVLEAEIDAEVSAKKKLTSLVLPRIGKQISVYGPWIFDRGHCHQPEIHPAEQIWWSEAVGNDKKYNLNVFSDSSGRFWWRDQMDDGTKLKPWGAPPIKGTFAIAFETEIDKPGQNFEVTSIDQDKIVAIPGSNGIHRLVYQNKTLVSFVPDNSAFNVSFERVGLKPGTTNIVRGFLVIETTVGAVTQIATQAKFQGASNPIEFPLGTDPNKVHQALERQLFKKDGGHYMFSILQTQTDQ